MIVVFDSPTSRCRLVVMDSTRKLANRLQGWIEQLFPNWTHRRHLHRWERQWLNPEFSPFWKTDQPQKELIEAVDSGWFPENQRVIDVGRGSGQVSRWLAAQGFSVLGLDYSAAAIENCRRLSAGHSNPPIFKVADLCDEDLRLEPAFSLIDRGCFHRIVGNLRSVFAQNIARATVEGGHLLLISGTFQDARVVNYGGARSDPQLREHVGEIFGDHFIIERAEPALINAREGQEPMPAVVWLSGWSANPSRQRLTSGEKIEAGLEQPGDFMSASRREYKDSPSANPQVDPKRYLFPAEAPAHQDNRSRAYVPESTRAVLHTTLPAPDFRGTLPSSWRQIPFFSQRRTEIGINPP